MPSLDSIHPELRSFARLAYFLLPDFTERKLRLFGHFSRVTRLSALLPNHVFDTTDYYFERHDGSCLRICIYSPKGHKPGFSPSLPALLWCHGGGYALGAPENNLGLVGLLMKASPCIVISPDYRLSIDAPFPAALLDCYAALLWLQVTADELGVRSDQIFIGGDSGGGGLCTALSLLARDLGEVNIAFQMPIYPMLDDRTGNTIVQDNNAPIWNSASNANAWKLYLKGLYGADNVPCYAAAARATDYSGLPETCTFVGDIEPFYGETCTYVESLQKAGVLVHFRVFKGCYHAFEFFCPNSTPGHDAIGFMQDCFQHATRSCFKAQPSSDFGA